jgi:hypothetical protein
VISALRFRSDVLRSSTRPYWAANAIMSLAGLSGATPATRVAAARGSGEVHARGTVDPAVTIASRKLDRHRRNPLPASKRPIPLLRHSELQVLVAHILQGLRKMTRRDEREDRRRDMAREVAEMWLRLSVEEAVDTEAAERIALMKQGEA